MPPFHTGSSRNLRCFPSIYALPKSSIPVVSCGYDLAGRQIKQTLTIPTAELETLSDRQREKEIQRQAVLFEQKVKSGQYMDGEKVTFSEFIDRWLSDYAEKNLAPATLNVYEQRLRDRIKPALGHIKIAKIQPHHLMEFYNNLAEQGVRADAYYIPSAKLIENLKVHKLSEFSVSAKTVIRLKKGLKTDIRTAKAIADFYGESVNALFSVETKNSILSGKTIKHHHDLISSVLSMAVKWQVIGDNPAERVVPPKSAKKPSKYYEEDQIAKLIQLLAKEPTKYRVCVMLAIDTGLRSGELVGLTWNDIDFDNCRISINKQRQYVSNKGVFEKTPKTDSGTRLVTISEPIIKLLKQYRLEQLENRVKFGNLWSSEQVFTHETGEAFHPHRPYKWFTEFLEKNNLPKITFHALRHTNASLLISQGVDVVTLSARLGHSDKSVTLNTYSHMINSKEAQAAKKMEQFYSDIM